MASPDTIWKNCSSCKGPIRYSSKYWICNVSTCNRKRLPQRFCSVSCWDAHVPMMNHRDSWALEKWVPSKEEAENPAPSSHSGKEKKKGLGGDDEILVIASRLKSYIKEQSGMSTSATVFPVLSDWLRRQSHLAIEKARQSDRKTILDRDL